MKRRGQVVAWVVAGVVALGIVGCAKPPLDEQKAAQAARDQAVAAQADKYATNSMNEALQALSNAEAKMTEKAYLEAKAGYIAAQAGFTKAVAEVEVGKQAMATANAAALQVLEKGWAGLKQTAARAISKLSGEMKQNWTTDSAMVANIITKAKDVAASPAEIKPLLEQGAALLEKWIANLKK